VAGAFEKQGLWERFGTGKGVWLAIVDRGFSKATVASRLGMSISVDATRGYVVPGAGLPRLPGEGEPDGHGTMVAFDALLAGYEATLLDIRISLDSNESSITGATCGFGHLADLLATHKDPDQPLVVANSWAVTKGEDYAASVIPPRILSCAAGDARLTEPYLTGNPCHVFNRALERLINQGADVVFAAGNDGSPLGEGGECQKVPGSIVGINSSPHVLTVSAANLQGEPLPNISVGPGELEQLKPDLASYSGFSGSGVYTTDSGSSAAAAVAAGVIAAIRTNRPNMTPSELKKTLIAKAAAKPNYWDCRLGAGVLAVP
jgi:subtilisin family serine protease